MRSRISLALIFACIGAMPLAGCTGKRPYKDTQIMMGTFVEVTSPDKRAKEVAFSEIRRIEGLLSKYLATSEVARLNKLGALKVSPETFFIIRKAKEFHRMTGGAFDITVAPLVTLWGFRDKNFGLPPANKIKETLKRVGSDKIILSEPDSMVKFSLAGMEIDLGAIAKGFAVDCAVKKLRDAGIKSCLINAGGQIYALGDRGGLPWKIAIRNPSDKSLFDYLYLKDRAVSTSGDYEQFFNVGDIHYCHIINPKTGYPAASGVSSVTVIAPDGLTADALSTSIFVIGKIKGERLIRDFPGTEMRVTERQPK